MATFGHKTPWDRLSLQNYVKWKWQKNGSSKKNILLVEGEMDIRQQRQQMSTAYGSVLKDFIYVAVDQLRDVFREPYFGASPVVSLFTKVTE